MMALGALRAIDEAGLRLVEDIAIVGGDDIALARYVTPKLTTIRQNMFLIGRLATDMMIDAVEERAGRQVDASGLRGEHVGPRRRLGRPACSNPPRNERRRAAPRREDRIDPARELRLQARHPAVLRTPVGKSGFYQFAISFCVRRGGPLCRSAGSKESSHGCSEARLLSGGTQPVDPSRARTRPARGGGNHAATLLRADALPSPLRGDVYWRDGSTGCASAVSGVLAPPVATIRRPVRGARRGPSISRFLNADWF
jgi:hypothetical protein